MHTIIIKSTSSHTKTNLTRAKLPTTSRLKEITRQYTPEYYKKRLIETAEVVSRLIFYLLSRNNKNVI
ncbi:hypothetical protein Hanom_Chr04g00316591 [Helianthus anomalus]